MKNLLPLDEAIAKTKADSLRDLKWQVERLKKQRKETIARIEQNRMVMPALDEAFGERAWASDYNHGASVFVDLGKKPVKKKELAQFQEKLVFLRELLGSLDVVGKSPKGQKGNEVDVSLRSEAFPGVIINYTYKLKKEDKCKIIKTRPLRELVCKA